MTSLPDVQQHCAEGPFPARKAKRYGSLTIFAIGFQTDGTPTREIRIRPDDCRTVTELENLINANTRDWFGELFLLNGATLEVEDKATVEIGSTMKFSIEHDEEWQEWKE